MDHAETIAIHNMMLMLARDSANECQKMHQRFYLDVQRVNVGKASEDSRDHLDIIPDTKTHLQGQDPDTWYHGAWARLRPSLPWQSQCTQLRVDTHIH